MEPYLLSAYCTKGFLEQFHTLLPAAPIDPNSRDGELWSKIHRFLTGKIRLELDMSQQELGVLYASLLGAVAGNGSVANFLMRDLLTQYTSGQQHRFQLAAPLPDPASCHYVFTNDEHLQEDALGVPVIHTQNCLKQWAKHSTPWNKIVAKNDPSSLKSWQELEEVCRPNHTVIICDNYLLAKERDNIQHNLLPLLKALLPKKQPPNMTYEILLMTHMLYEVQPKKSVHIQQAYNDISQVLERGLEGRRFTFGLVKHGRKDWHDRHVFTNAFALESGNSFDYFNHQREVWKDNQTTLKVFPYPTEEGQGGVYGNFCRAHLQAIKSILQRPHIAKRGHTKLRLLEEI